MGGADTSLSSLRMQATVYKTTAVVKLGDFGSGH